MKIGLTTGNFDLFHKGHENLLRNAKKYVDKLIVCVSDEEYSLKIKNKKPVISLEERMRIVKSFDAVDEVDVQTLYFGKVELIKKYDPDYLFVGDDHIDDYNGEGLGVPVIYLPRTKGISSTELRENIGKNMTEKKKIALKNLKDLKMIFDKAGIFFWITGGFLLGLYRQGDMIEGDEYDIDIKIWKKDLDKLNSVRTEFNNKSLLQERGRFKERVVKYSPDNKVCSVAFRRQMSQLDIKVFVPKDEIVYYIRSSKNGLYCVHTFPKKMFENFVEIEWNGVKVNCPKNIEEYLSYRYGENWKTPYLRKDGWNSFEDKFNKVAEYWKKDNF